MYKSPVSTPWGEWVQRTRQDMSLPARGSAWGLSADARIVSLLMLNRNAHQLVECRPTKSATVVIVRRTMGLMPLRAFRIGGEQAAGPLPYLLLERNRDGANPHSRIWRRSEGGPRWLSVHTYNLFAFSPSDHLGRTSITRPRSGTKQSH